MIESSYTRVIASYATFPGFWKEDQGFYRYLSNRVFPNEPNKCQEVISFCDQTDRCFSEKIKSLETEDLIGIALWVKHYSVFSFLSSTPKVRFVSEVLARQIQQILLVLGIETVVEGFHLKLDKNGRDKWLGLPQSNRPVTS